MNLAGVVRGDAVVLAVMDQNIGVGDAGRRPVQIVDGHGPVANTTWVVTIKPGFNLRKVPGLGFDVLRTWTVFFGSTPGAVNQQQENRSDSALFVVLEFTKVGFDNARP